MRRGEELERQERRDERKEEERKEGWMSAEGAYEWVNRGRNEER